MPRSIRAFAVAVVVTAAPAVSQQDPVGRPAAVELVRVVGSADGMPRPGVLVYARSAGDAAARLDEQGYLIAEDQRVRIMRKVPKATTDPEGRAELRVGMPIRAWQLMVAPPHVVNGKPEKKDGAWFVKVDATPAVGVRVVDANGAPLADFAVALHAAGKDMAIAITDDTGRAVLGVPKEFAARAVLAPAGWIGPKQGFPSIAESLEGRRGVKLQLPPHGSLRLRRVRGGIPEAGPVRAGQFNDPTTYEQLCPTVSAWADKAKGVVYPFVALGLDLWSYPQLGSTSNLECKGPAKAGEVRDVDIDLGAVLTLRCDGLAAEVRRHSVTVRLVTDKGEEKRYAMRRPDGRYEVKLGRRLEGTRIVRVLVDVKDFSGFAKCDHGLRAASIDLGTIRMSRTEPQLRGLVLDPDGKPVADLPVAVSEKSQRNTGYVVKTDAEGRFASRGPVLRDEYGAPVELYARVISKDYASEPVQAEGGKLTLNLKPRPKPTGPVPQPIRTDGSITVHVLDKLDWSKPQNAFRLVGDWSVGRLPRVAVQPDGTAKVTFRGLRGGTYRLLAPGADFHRFIALDGLEVPGDGPCTDPRLQGLTCADQMRTAVVRVIDEQGVPMAGASISVPGGAYRTDGTGAAKVYLGKKADTVATITASGKRTYRHSQWPDEVTIRLEPAADVVVEVPGLPADVPRDRVEIWLREDKRGSFDGPRRTMQGGNSVTMPIPPAGRYRLMLLATKRHRNGSRSSTIHAAKELVEIAENKDRKLVIKLSDDELARLRKAIANMK